MKKKNKKNTYETLDTPCTKNNRWDIKDPKRNYIEWDINRMVKNTENDTSPY